jgi:hypothetical protein
MRERLAAIITGEKLTITSPARSKFLFGCDPILPRVPGCPQVCVVALKSGTLAAESLQKLARPTIIIPATCWGTGGLIGCMKGNSLLQIIPTFLMISAAMIITTMAAEKVDPDSVKKGMLTALNNQVTLSADQQDKAKTIIDKHVADLEAVKNDATLDKAGKKAKVVELRKQYVTDINGILTPDQQTKWAASRETNKAKIKAHVKEKAAQKTSQ